MYVMRVMSLCKLAAWTLRNTRSKTVYVAENSVTCVSVARNGVRRPSLGAADHRHYSRTLPQGPSLKEFICEMSDQTEIPVPSSVPYLDQTNYGTGRKVYFDVYGCQMNVNDTEVIWAILKQHGFLKTEDLREADIVLIVTCAIREGAENKVWNRIDYLKGVRNSKNKRGGGVQMKIGVLGCMAERLKHQLLEREQAVDLIAGPDSYRDLPRLLALTDHGQRAVNVLLSQDETYADVAPVRLNRSAVSAFVSVTRGCDNMCTYCIVPFTRGRERSRPLSSVLAEVRGLVAQGVRQVVLLGQNVNSYRDVSVPGDGAPVPLARGFNTVYRRRPGGARFAELLDAVADVHPELRVRFTSPHPKDFPDEVLNVIQARPNVCKSLHLPAQSGNSQVLQRMRRGYTRQAYLDLVASVRDALPGVALTSDFICGFCGETDEQFADTLSLAAAVGYHTAYMFPYSMRERTTAHRRLQDDVPRDVKLSRLQQLVTQVRAQAEVLNQQQIGQRHLVLVEGASKRSPLHLVGRNDANTKVVFPRTDLSVCAGHPTELQRPATPGDYVEVLVQAATSQVLRGTALHRTTLAAFSGRRKADDGAFGL